MSKNKLAPRSLQKYVVVVIERTKESDRQTFKYFANQREAKAWAKDQPGKRLLFRIGYDYYGEL